MFVRWWVRGILLWMFVQNDSTPILVPIFWYQDPDAKFLVPTNQELERRSLSKIELGGAGGCKPPPGPSKNSFMDPRPMTQNSEVLKLNPWFRGKNMPVFPQQKCTHAFADKMFESEIICVFESSSPEYFVYTVLHIFLEAHNLPSRLLRTFFFSE